MGEAEGGPVARAGRIAGLDISVAHPARVYDYWLGGKDNFAADREAARAGEQGHDDGAAPRAVPVLGHGQRESSTTSRRTADTGRSASSRSSTA